jgi:hypothetical protein
MDSQESYYTTKHYPHNKNQTQFATKNSGTVAITSEARHMTVALQARKQTKHFLLWVHNMK